MRIETGILVLGSPVIWDVPDGTLQDHINFGLDNFKQLIEDGKKHQEEAMMVDIKQFRRDAEAVKSHLMQRDVLDANPSDVADPSEIIELLKDIKRGIEDLRIATGNKVWNPTTYRYEDIPQPMVF